MTLRLGRLDSSGNHLGQITGINLVPIDIYVRDCDKCLSSGMNLFVSFSHFNCIVCKIIHFKFDHITFIIILWKICFFEQQIKQEFEQKCIPQLTNRLIPIFILNAYREKCKFSVRSVCYFMNNSSFWKTRNFS